MNESANKAFTHFAGSRPFDATPVEKLQTLATGYPYFPVAQFFLAKKLKEEYGDAYINQAQKTILYFNNAFWFDHLLTNEIIVSEVEPLVADYSSNSVMASEAVFEPEHVIEAEMIHGVEEETEIDSFSDEPSNIDEPIIVEEHEKTVAEAPAEKVATPVFSGVISPSGNEPDAGVSVANVEEQSKINVPVLENAAEDITTSTAGNLANEEPDEHEKMFRSIKAMLDFSSEEADADIENAEIPLDPYYTIDYFASQGIKLDLEVNPQDKLGQNLKKFTQWLRHMKKLGPEDAKIEIDNNNTEADIQKQADSSNSVREVVTEAMATVLVQQGKKAKAIELYNKLSFLNPDKSIYFADQINKLKGLK